jgi:mono/diheme cytochrome c family protein
MPPQSKRIVLAVSAVVITACAFNLLSALQNKTESPTVVAVEGGQIFRNHCAVCHGKDGRGRGPATIALKELVPDLTLIARRNEGAFPAREVKAVIAGTDERSADGSREMPIWGPIFHNFEWDQDLGEVRLQNVTDYVHSIQQK